jgi:hypothetical protein
MGPCLKMKLLASGWWECAFWDGSGFTKFENGCPVVRGSFFDPINFYFLFFIFFFVTSK